MSRQSSAQRPLTLTEELEKLEQSITLTLQEIDHNFSQAHRIVTSSVLPLVEQYAEHSRDVWEGAKFWKQFFEASANVSLSGYEEHPNEDTTQEQTATEDESNATESNITESTSYDTPSSNRHDTPGEHEDIDLSSLAISSHSTPRAPPPHEKPTDDTPSSITTSSPYETLKQQITESEPPFEIQDPSTLPSTPGGSPSKRNQRPGLSPSPSPFIPPTSTEQPLAKHQKPTDPVMHRMLDKTYRVQATPLGKGFEKGRSKFTATPKPKQSSSSKYAFDDSPLSSPEPEAPQLNSELFSSPIKGAATPTPRRSRSHNHHERITPKPGISVLTPAKGKGAGGKQPVWDSDEEELDVADDEAAAEGPSPPKTMQFHVPQSRLMKTPAKEASKRIVEDLLVSAGANDVTESVEDEQSPSVVRRVGRLEDETF